jgi:hypothetical protein
MSNVKTFKGGKSKAIVGLKRIDERLVASADFLLVAGHEKGQFTVDLDQAAVIIASLDAVAAAGGEVHSDDKLIAELFTPVAAVTPVDPEGEETPEIPLTKAQQAALDAEFDSGCAANPVPVASDLVAPAETAAETEPAADPAPARHEGQYGDETPEQTAAAEAGVNNMFSQLMGGSAPAPAEPAKPAKVRSGAEPSYKIEKDRAEQNGIKRPSTGGTCRAIWDALDAMSVTLGHSPSTKEMKTLVDTHGFDKTTVGIQMYQWRKFNGIFGRVAKVASVVTVATSAAPLPSCDDLPVIDFPADFVPSELTSAPAQTDDLPVLDL